MTQYGSAPPGRIDVINHRVTEMNFRLVLFPWPLGARDVIKERQLAEIIEWEYKYVYLFNGFIYSAFAFFKLRKRLANRTNQSSKWY